MESACVETLPITIIYVDLQNNIAGTVKTTLNHISRDALIQIIGLHNVYKERKYTISDILRYCINLQELKHFTTPDEFVIRGWKYTNEFEWPESIQFFHPLNEIFVLFREKPKVNSKGKTKRVAPMNNTKSRKNEVIRLR